MFRNLFIKNKNPMKLLAEAKNKLSEENPENVINIARPFIENEDEEIKCEANHIVGLAYFKLNNYKLAQEFFEYVASVRYDTNSWFNVITSSILAGDLAKGKSAFENAFKCQEQSGYSQQPSLPFIRYYYACALCDVSEFEKALEQLNELKSIYMKLVITDDTFLYMRGVPFLSHTLELTKKVFDGMKKNFYTNEWLSELEQSIDNDGKEYIRGLKARVEK